MAYVDYMDPDVRETYSLTHSHLYIIRFFIIILI